MASLLLHNKAANNSSRKKNSGNKKGKQILFVMSLQWPLVQATHNATTKGYP